jgi:RNA polymerase sigma-70 factor (ECF subfamily)
MALSARAVGRLRLVKGQGEQHPRGAPAGPSLDDSELLAAVRTGDEAAAAALYHRARPHLELTVDRLLGPGDADRDDVVQIALVELVRSIGRFRGECSLDSWIFKVAAHAVCKHIRRRRLERGVFERRSIERADVPASDLSGREVEARDLLRRIRKHLDAMDPDRASAFLLHDVCGLDLREAARILEIGVAAAQKRLVRGRRELFERIAADPELADLLVTQGEES